MYRTKRDFIIEKQSPRSIIKYTKCLSYPLQLKQFIMVSSSTSSISASENGLEVTNTTDPYHSYQPYNQNYIQDGRKVKSIKYGLHPNWNLCIKFEFKLYAFFVANNKKANCTTILDAAIQLRSSGCNMVSCIQSVSRGKKLSYKNNNECNHKCINE